MKKYQKSKSFSFAVALVCVFSSTIFTVALQPFKGDVLDYAVAGKMHSLPISRQSKKTW